MPNQMKDQKAAARMLTLDRQIGRKIRVARQRVGMSRTELAERIGFVSGASVTKIELGVQGLSASRLVMAAEVLGVSVATLTEGVGG